ncbi:MAG TPA: SRPBCC domain-containing protein [Candidatus Limnocylindrales bacterium]|nr:SRPBCC domain-containing protein [Candidatus Limnocylindrales bacterium]
MTTVTSSGRARVSLVGETDIRIERDFDARKDLVYRAVTDPELIRRWWNAKRGEVTVCEVDLRVGGRWRYVMVTTDGMEVGFHGTILELIPGEKVVQTELYEMPGLAEEDATVNTMELLERDGRTTMTVLQHCRTAEIREAILQSGMEAGMQDAYDLLEEVARSLD